MIPSSGPDEQMNQTELSSTSGENAEFVSIALNPQISSQLQKHPNSVLQDEPNDNDFEVAAIAKQELQEVIKEFEKDVRHSKSHQFVFSNGASKTKVIQVLQEAVGKEMETLKSSVDSLEAEWKESHGLVYDAFKKICRTLDDHKSILKVFPSQNNYASPLVGSITIIIQAAKLHSEIALNLSKSVAEISEKVATCSVIISIIRTSGTKRKLANIYARMFRFYRDTLKWYLQSRFQRFKRSFNENLLKSFEEAKKDVEDSIVELYREASVANIAMVAMIQRKFSALETELSRQRQCYEARDTLAGKRLEKMMETTWARLDLIENMIELASLKHHVPKLLAGREAIEASPHNPTDQNHCHGLSAFILDEQVPPILSKQTPWAIENDVIHKIQKWLNEEKVSKTMWISSTHSDNTGVSSASAALYAVVAAAWQAETPVLTGFCKRVHPCQRRPGMTPEQVGLISLIYSLIRQLLQFNRSGDNLMIDEKDLDALNGEASSWDAAIKIVRVLLQDTPIVTFCAIENLNNLEFGNGRNWCNQLVEVLKKRQLESGSSFNILFSTSGQSFVLSQYITARERYAAPKTAKDPGNIGRGASIQL
ncbi:unnamed protein product [Periconia digitata]|uniref:DUF7708 domain-containing protein n=1 Tax=Periconia digitata TaxID=1303443 RepID=A0A9W4U5T7_9PLEO|nr:unnamed protein product [Periconia digitata]